MKIIYSKYDGDTLTEYMDEVLDYRDTLCKELVFKKCSLGRIRTEFGKKLARAFMHFCTAVSWIVAVLANIWVMAIFSPWAVIPEAIAMGLILYGLHYLFERYLAPEEIPLCSLSVLKMRKSAELRHARYRIYDQRDPKNRKHNKERAVYFGPGKYMLKKHLIHSDDETELRCIDRLLTVANRLSDLRSFAKASNEIEEFMKNYGEENVDVSVSVEYMDDMETDFSVYEITLKEKCGNEAGSVIPTEPATLQVRVPYAPGVKLLDQRKNKKNKKDATTLDLGYFDPDYDQIMELGEQYRSEIKKDWTGRRKSEKSPVFQKLSQLNPPKFAEIREIMRQKRKAQEAEIYQKEEMWDAEALRDQDDLRDEEIRDEDGLRDEEHFRDQEAVKSQEDIQVSEGETVFGFPEFPQEMGNDDEISLSKTETD